MLTHEEMTEYLFIDAIISKITSELIAAIKTDVPEKIILNEKLLEMQKRKQKLLEKYIGIGE